MYGVSFEQPEPPDVELADGDVLTLGSLTFDVHAPAGALAWARRVSERRRRVRRRPAVRRIDWPHRSAALRSRRTWKTSLARICELGDDDRGASRSWTEHDDRSRAGDEPFPHRCRAHRAALMRTMGDVSRVDSSRSSSLALWLGAAAFFQRGRGAGAVRRAAHANAGRRGRRPTAARGVLCRAWSSASRWSRCRSMSDAGGWAFGGREIAGVVIVARVRAWRSSSSGRASSGCAIEIGGPLEALAGGRCAPHGVRPPARHQRRLARRRDARRGRRARARRVEP